jgi:hypothetical protein
MEGWKVSISMTRATLTILFSLFLCVVTTAQTPKADCPTISVMGPPDITAPNDTMVFTMKSSENLQPDVRFEWTVSDGTILEGQGTKSMKVKTPSYNQITDLTATVRLQGLPQGCLSVASETGAVASAIFDPIIDSYGQLSLNEEKARMQNAATVLEMNPRSKILILKYFPKITSASRLRINQLSDFLVHYLRVPRNRFEFVVRIKPQTETMISLPPIDFKYKD